MLLFFRKIFSVFPGILVIHKYLLDTFAVTLIQTVGGDQAADSLDGDVCSNEVGVDAGVADEAFLVLFQSVFHPVVLILG